MIHILGFCGSPRVGNSQYLLEQALDAVKKRADLLEETVEIDTCTVRGKKLSGCLMCQSCMKDGTCVIKDDFAQLQEKWLAADVILYSVPVYHMGIPAQLKAFIDRLGNSMFGKYKSILPDGNPVPQKNLKVVGCIAQGIHFSSGQEHAITQIIDHALLCGYIPVSGDLWESYLGGVGWTGNQENRHALQEQYESNSRDAQVAVSSCRSLGTRALDLSVLIRNGVLHSPRILNDPAYFTYKNLNGKAGGGTFGQTKA